MDKHGQFLSAVLVMMLALIMIAMFSVYAMILEGNGNVYTSLTSSSISSYMAEQIANQYSNIMQFSSSVNSTFSGMLKNFIAGYYPSYVLADSLLNYTNLTYDYVMPPNVTVPNSVEAYVGVILNNTQSSPTPAPFQQMINVPNTTSFWNYINTTSGYFGQNVEFFYGNGKIIPSWLESYNSSSGKWWIKIGTISASSVTKIYMGFASKTTNLFNTNNVGEAPQLSSTYAEYDDGASVFTQYGGRSWSSFTFVGGTWTSVNGYLQQTATTGSYAGGPAALIESTSYPATGSYILGAAFDYTTEADARVGIIAVATPTTTPDVFGYRFIGQQGSSGAGFISFLNDQVAWVVDNIYQGVISTDYTMIITNAGGTWSGNLYSGYGETGTILTSLSATSYSANNEEGTNTGYVGISAAYNGATLVANPINVMWFYMHAYPPSGVMPSVTFGSVA